MTRLFAGLTAGVVIAVAGMAPAMADGMPKGAYAAPPPMIAPGCAASKFAGFYAGLNVGFGSLTSSLHDRDSLIAPAGSYYEHTEDGWSFGGQAGYNWVQCNTFFGIEADFAWANIDSTTGYGANVFPGGLVNISHSMDWLASVRTRSGIALGDMLIYVSGGIAWADISTTYTNNAFPFTNFSSSDTRVGWVAGVGTEYAWTDRIRITGDVLYYDFGTDTTNVAFAPLNFRFDDHHTLWVSRIGINFALGGARESLVAHDPLK